MLKGKTALVTGSLGGIGFATARALAEMGATVFLSGLASAETIAARVAEIEALGVACVHLDADLRRPDQIADMIAAIPGGPDILVNNAVVRFFGATEDFDPAHWDEALAVNLSAPFHTTRLSLPGMKARGWGRIVNMASVYSFMATANRIDYVTTKTALLGLTRTVALECARTGVTCNAVCPGTVLTPNIESRLRNEMQRDGTDWDTAEAQFLSIRQPSRRFVKDSNVAGLIAFLCGPHSADINGAALPIDGAWLTSR